MYFPFPRTQLTSEIIINNKINISLTSFSWSVLSKSWILIFPLIYGTRAWAINQQEKLLVRNLQYLVSKRYVWFTKKFFKENSIHSLMIAPRLQSQHFPVMRLDLLISAFAPSLGFQSIVFHGPSWVRSAAALQHQMIHSLSSINNIK